MPEPTELRAIKEKLLYYLAFPIEFVREIIGVEPTPQQAEVLKAIATSSSIVVRSGHGIGKTAVEAWAILWFLLLHPYARVPCTAPTKHQLEDILWPELNYWIGRSKVLSRVLVWTKEHLGVKGHEEVWFAVPRTATTPENLQGFHGKYLMFVVDEGSGVPQEIMEVVEGALTNEGAKLLMCGNPTQISGTFHAAFHKDRHLYTTFHFSSADSPLVSGEYVLRIAEKFGRDSDAFRVRVLGEFPRGEADTFIRLDLVEAAVARKVRAGGKWKIGVDPAYFGDDESVICAARGKVTSNLDGFHGLDGWQLGAKVIRRVKEIRKTGYEEWIDVRVDVTGIGASCVDYLRRMQRKHRIRVIPINFAWGGDEDYANLPTVLWADMRDVLETIQIPRDEELISQLTTRKYEFALDGRIVIERKKKLKNRGLPSPDRAEALALCFSSIDPREFDTEDIEEMMSGKEAEVVGDEVYSEGAEVV